MNSGKTAAILGLILVVCVACATPGGSPGAVADIGPGQRPAPDTDEAGLWMQMDRVEEDLKTSGRLLADPELNTYVRDMVCELVGPYCADIRVYVVQTPHFNASMAPNGTMQVWTGLLLRAENEAQLAYVLGHEIGHYLRRHSVQLWRDVRAKSGFLAYFRLLTAAAGVGYVAPLADLAALASVYAYSRDNEREADELGLELMVKAGYDPREAPKIWEALLKERAAAKDPASFIFFATHPPTEERIETLKKLAQTGTTTGGSGKVGREQLLAKILPLRATFLRDELRRREFAGCQVVLDRLFASGVGLGEVHFFQGELYRLRAQDGDPERAIASFEKALEFTEAPPETHRALGLLFSRTGQKEKARSSFERYLHTRPDAEDRAMIDAYLREVQ